MAVQLDHMDILCPWWLLQEMAVNYLQPVLRLLIKLFHEVYIHSPFKCRLYHEVEVSM